MGEITGAKILTSASPTMNSLTTTNTTTTTLTSSGTGTGYVIQRVNYPGGVLDADGVTSTVVLNSICDSNTMLFLQPVGWSVQSISALNNSGSSCPYPSIGCCTSGSYTLTSGSAASTVLPINVVLVNY
jgi:hypothetical protein